MTTSGFSSKNRRQPIVGETFDDALHLRVAQPRLGLALELRLGHLHRDDGGHPFPHVLPAEVLLELLGEIELFQVIVQASGEGALEADRGACRPRAC